MRGALVILLLAAPVYADNGPHKEGEYSGVIPGQAARDTSVKPAKPRHPPPKGTLSWIGFEAQGGGAEVFFQSVAPFEVTQRIEGSQLVVRLSLTRLAHNTWRQIDTRFFENPLSGIVARTVGLARATKDRPARGAGIEARVAFKNAKDAKEATLRTATEADGMFYAYLTFPQGTASPTVSPVPVTEPSDEPDEPETESKPEPATKPKS